MVRIVISCLLLCFATPVIADDWGVTRSAFDPRLVGRYKAMLRRRPGDAYALRHLLRLYSKHRSVGQLIAEYRKATRQKPKVYSNWIVLGNLYRRSGKRAKAIDCYGKASLLKPRSPAPIAALAELYRRGGKLKMAAESYKRALALTTAKASQKRFLRALADMALSNQDLQSAKAYFQRLVSIDPNDKLVRLELARALAKSNHEDEAIKEYEALLKHTRDSSYRANIRKEIAILQQKKGRYDKAIANFRKAMSLTTRGHWLRKELTKRIVAIYRQREELPSLIKYYEKRWKRRGYFEEAVLAKLYDETGNESAALKAYRRALALSPNAVDIRLRLVALFDRAGKRDEATEQYRKLAKLAPGEPRYRLELAKRLHRQGKKKEAISVLEKCGKRFSRDASVHSALADLYSRWGDKKRAMREARLLVRIEPQDVSHLVNLGEQHYVSGKKKKALEIWKRLLSAIPIRHKALARLAEVYSQHELVTDAVRLYRKAIALSPQTLTYRRSLAMLLESSRRSNEAIAAWQDLLSTATKARANRQLIAEARSRIVGLLHRSYRLRYYARSYARRFGATPPDIEAGRFLAEAWIKRRRFAKAEKVYLRILKLVPQDVEALTALERVYRKQRKFAKAVALLKRLAKLNSTNTRRYYQRIADLQLLLFNDREALKYAHKAIEIGAQDPKAYQRLAELYERKEDFKGALKAYDQALKLNPNLYPAHLARAKLLTRLADYQAAARSYRTLLEIARTPEMIRKAFRRAISLSEFLGTLDELERSLVERAVSTNANSETYKGLLVRVYLRRAPALIDDLRHGDSRRKKLAREKLDRMGRMGIAALLDELAAGKHKKPEIIQLLGYLGNSHAVVALHRTLMEKQAASEVIIYANRSIRSGGRFSQTGKKQRARRNKNRVLSTLALGRLADQRSIPFLIGLRADREGPVREAAAWSLAQIADPRSARALFSALADRRSSVQMLACLGLGLRGKKRLQPVLEEVMFDQQRNEWVRAACAWAQGVLGHPKAVAALTEALRSGSELVQKSAVLALGEINTPQSRQALLASLWTKWPKVQSAIRWALSRPNANGGTKSKPTHRMQRRLPDLWIVDSAVGIRSFKKRLLKNATAVLDQRSREVLSKLVWQHPTVIAQGISSGLSRHRDVLLRLLKELNRHPNRLSVGLLLDESEPPPTSEQNAALRVALKNISTQIEPSLRELLKHRDVMVRRLASRVWVKCRPATLSNHIGTLLNDEDISVRIAFLDSLADTGQAGGIPRSQWPLKSSHWQEREAVLLAFSTLHRSGATALAAGPDVIRALSGDNNGYVREQAARVLGSWGGNSARAALTRALEDRVDHVRYAACKALEKLDSAGQQTMKAEAPDRCRRYRPISPGLR
jgi:cellulose synthase operon protein C